MRGKRIESGTAAPGTGRTAMGRERMSIEGGADVPAALREEGRLVAAGDRFRFDEPAHICLPYDHDLLARARRLVRFGRRPLAAMAWAKRPRVSGLRCTAEL
ncbi:hypothetical protein AB0L13_44285 [Saccharopolyspora shandongensis]|uniref:hypothetical protein n=1 Tax=Saccharopolyspora shandongensis TaxID=418495 RepID=UPI003438B373